MLKRSFALFLLCVGIFFLPSPVLSDNEFTVDSNVTYKVQDSGKTIVTHEITLENNFSTLYATTYTLSLENIDAQAPRATDDSGKEIPIDTQKDDAKTSIKLNFPDAVVGKSAKRHFFITYENTSFAVRTGEVWEISIPRLSDEASFRNYDISLEVPDFFGLEAYVSPKPSSFEAKDGYKYYKFTKSEILQTGVTAGFGEFQVFSFSLSYHLENPLARSSEVEIALPPDTSFQKVYYTKITPTPDRIQIDTDGNWLATYKLSSRQRMDVVAEGSVQIFASFRSFPKPTEHILSDNLKETMYWQVNDSEIKALASRLKTARAIYDYVSKNLSYDVQRVQPNVQRFGAIKALENPSQAICMEFTDLFITIARAAGIPAREINGYAYTENPDIQPLGLVADVLHSWPEYYDREKGTWIPVDPTWGSTTGGQDYFTKLDLRHFAFAIHGEDSVKPYAPGSYKLGPNPQKDVFVSFGKLLEDRFSTPMLSFTPKRLIPFLDSIYALRVYNPGPASLSSIYSTVYFDGSEHSRDFIELLPPFASYETQIKVPFSLLGKDTPDRIKIIVDGSQTEIPTGKSRIIIYSLISIFVLFIAIILAILIKLGRIRVNVRIPFKIKNPFKSIP